MAILCARRSVCEHVLRAAVLLPASGSLLGHDQQNARMPPLLLEKMPNTALACAAFAWPQGGWWLLRTYGCSCTARMRKRLLGRRWGVSLPQERDKVEHKKCALTR